MRMTFKHVLVLWFFLMAGIGALLLNAYSKLKPEILISLLSEQVQKNYPGTRLIVGKVDYRLSVDFNMGLKDVSLLRGANTIGTLEEIEVRLPWWLLLFEKGNAQVSLNNLIVFIDEDRPGIRETDGDKKEKARLSEQAPRISLEVPGFLDDAQFTLRGNGITVKGLRSGRRYFTLNKILVREFQFGKNSAFELNLPISLSHNGISLDSELWLFGDLTPESEEWKLKFRGDFRTSDTGDKIQLEDLLIDGKARLKPSELDLTAELAFFIEKKEVGKGSLKAHEEELAIDLKLDQFPLQFFSLFEAEMNNPYFPGLEAKASGSLSLIKGLKEESLKLAGELKFDGPLKLGPSAEVAGKWRLTFSGSKWETSFITPKGEVSFFRRSVIDFKNGGVAQFVEELGFTEVDLAGPIQMVQPLEKFLGNETKEYSSSTVAIKRCKLGERVITGHFKYGISPDLNFYSSELKDGQGSFRLNYNLTGRKEKLDLEASRFSWDPSFRFLVPIFSAKQGNLSGSIEGRWAGPWTEGLWRVNLKASGLSEARGKWFAFFDKLWKVFEVDPQQSSDQQWNLVLRSGKFELESLVLDGPDPARISGRVDSKVSTKSFLILSYPKNRKWKPVRKEFTEALVEKTDND